MQPQPLARKDGHVGRGGLCHRYEAQVLRYERVDAQLAGRAGQVGRGGGLGVGDERVELGIHPAAAHAAVADGFGKGVAREAVRTASAEAYIDSVRAALHRGYDRLGAVGACQYLKHDTLPIKK